MAMNLSGLTTGSEGGTRVSGDARRLGEIRFISSEPLVAVARQRIRYLLSESEIEQAIETRREIYTYVNLHNSRLVSQAN